MPPLTADTLKQRHRAVRDGQDADAATRLHRAISWLGRAEQESGDTDACFIFQWIALNAAYAREFSHDQSERDRFRQFVATLVGLDAQRSLHQALFSEFSGPIRTLIDNRFVFEPFWTALREHDPSNRWEASFAGSRKGAIVGITPSRNRPDRGRPALWAASTRSSVRASTSSARLTASAPTAVS